MYAQGCGDGECQSGCAATMFWQGRSEDGHTTGSFDRGPSSLATLTPAVIPQLPAKPRALCFRLHSLHVLSAMAGLLEQLDGSISEILAAWNIYTTLIAFSIVGFLAFIIYDSADADTHPLLLARQAVASYVRQPGESAIFRSPETPHGCMYASLYAAAVTTNLG